MGRHPECKVHRDDMHVSLQHFAIVGDHVAGWHLECLTPDGCVVVHERTVKMGRPRKLKHGDAIVVMVYKKSGKEDRKPLIGYRFEVGATPLLPPPVSNTFLVFWTEDQRRSPYPPPTHPTHHPPPQEGMLGQAGGLGEGIASPGPTIEKVGRAGGIEGGRALLGGGVGVGKSFPHIDAR